MVTQTHRGALMFTLQRGPYHGQGTRSIYTPAPVNLWLKNALGGDINPWALLALCTYRKSLFCSLCAALQRSNAGAGCCVWKPQEDGTPRTTSKGIDLFILLKTNNLTKWLFLVINYVFMTPLKETRFTLQSPLSGRSQVQLVFTKCGYRFLISPLSNFCPPFRSLQIYLSHGKNEFWLTTF